MRKVKSEGKGGKRGPVILFIKCAYIIICIIILSNISGFSQDFEPQQHTFTYSTSAGDIQVLLNTSNPLFQDNRFLLGWHWGNGRTISSVLKMTQSHLNCENGFTGTGFYDNDGITLLNTPDSAFADGVDVIMNTPVVGHNWSKFSPAFSSSMQWEPALHITLPVNDLQTVEDSAKPVFGFRTNGGHSFVENNHSRLVFDNTDKGTVVLDNNWPDDEIYHLPPPYLDNTQYERRYRILLNDPIWNRDYNGTDLFLTLNLRREDNSTDQSETENILEIRVFYLTVFEDAQEDPNWQLVKFAWIPDKHKDSIILLPFNRGKARLTDSVNGDEVVYIKKSMLPIDTDPGRKDITITAKMIFDDQTPSNSNFNHNLRQRSSYLEEPLIDGQPNNPNNHIKRLRIQVIYSDQNHPVPVSIDWIRIETTVAQNLFRGLYDDSIIVNAQRAITNLTRPEFRDRGIRPYRFYLKDEGGPMYWGVHRYINKLIGNIGVNEVGIDPWPKQRMYYEELNELWASFGFMNISLNPVPFIRYGYNWDGRYDKPQDSVSFCSFGFQGGYKGNYWSRVHYNDELDSIHSDYEIKLPNKYDSNGNYLGAYTFQDMLDDESAYRGVMDGGITIQQRIENRTNILMSVLDDNKQQNFLFSGKPWWAEMWISNSLTQHIVQPGDQAYVGNDTVLTIGVNGCDRPFTGEEITFQLWEPLILGTKGLIYDLEPTEHSFDDRNFNPRKVKPFTRIGIWNGQFFFDKTKDDTEDRDLVPADFRLTDDQRNNLLFDDQHFLYGDFSNNIGSDWILIPTPNSSQWDFSRIQDYLGTYQEMKRILGLDTNKLYIGRKSNRSTLYKIHKWVKANENTLMDLRLQAWYGKGYRSWYVQHPDIQDGNLMDKYINTHKIKTRWPFSYDANNNPHYEQNSSIDSGFYDLTLLKNIHYPINESIYLGVQNRRTDPLLPFNPIKFIPTAEFDSLVNWGIPFTDPSIEFSRIITSYIFWWFRLGSRIITIPFSALQTNNKHSICSGIRINEVGNSMTDWFMQKPYNDKISNVSFKFLYPLAPFDEYIPNDYYFSLFLLPGQGKILKLEYLYSYREDENEGPIKGPPHMLSVDTQHKIYLHTELEFKGTSCDSIINTNPLFARGLPVILDRAECDLTRVSDYTKPPLDTSLKPCTSEDLMYMTRKPAKFVARWEIIDNTIKARLYLIWNGICYCDDYGEGYILASRGTLDTVDISSPIDTIRKVTTQIFMDSTNQVVGSYLVNNFPTKDPTYIGTTTINASFTRNYVSWSDAQRGIGIGWMYPGDSIIRGISYIPFVQMPNGEIFPTLVNPEMNRYSRVELGEDECALIFEGRKFATLDDSTNQIFYTRIKVDSLGNIVHFLPNASCDMTYQIQKDISGTMSMISFGTTGSRHRNATIIRNVANYNMPNPIDPLPGSLAIKMDRVVWEATDESGNNIIECAGYDFSDTARMTPGGIEWVPSCYTARIPTIIKALDGNVQSPSIAQGVMKDQKYFNGLDTQIIKTYYNDSALVMAFGVNDSLMYQIPQNFWTLMEGGEYNVNMIPNINELSARGTNPSLPVIMSVKDDSLYQYMRVFYDTDSSFNNQSGQYFYKGNNFNEKYNYFIGFSDQNGKKKWFSPITLLDTNGIISPVITSYKIDNGKFKIKDTLATEWFSIGQIKELNYIEQGDMTNGYSMNIQRHRDGKIWELTESKLNNKNYKFHKKVFINGMSDEYRIIWSKHNNQITTMEQLVIGNLPEKAFLNIDQNERLLKIIDINEQILDLSDESYSSTENKMKLLVYPNPAKEEMYIVTYLPQTEAIKGTFNNTIIIKLYNSIGEEILKKEVTAGQIIRIPINNIVNGTYFVIASINDSKSVISSESKSVLIQR